MIFKFILLLNLLILAKSIKAQPSKSSTRSSTWSKTSTAIPTNSASSHSPPTKTATYETSDLIPSTSSQTEESTPAQPSQTLTDSSSTADFYATSSISVPQTISDIAAAGTSTKASTLSSSRSSSTPTKFFGTKPSGTLSTSKTSGTKLNALTTRPRSVVVKKPTQKLANTKLCINNLIKIKFVNSSSANSSDILNEIDKTVFKFFLVFEKKVLLIFRFNYIFYTVNWPNSENYFLY